MTLSLLYLSIGINAVGGVLALLCGKNPQAAKNVGCLFGAIAAAASLAGGLLAIAGPAVRVSFDTSFAFAQFSILLYPLSGLMLTVISILALAAWIYGFSYFDDYKEHGLGAMCFFMNFFVLSMNLVITVDNAFWFLVFFELMSLTSYFLVICEQTPQSIHGGFMYLIMAHVGFILIAISYFIMAAGTGSFDFQAFRTTDFGAGTAGLAFVLAFLGFGMKAGMIPFHQWLPEAHPAAPSNVSALMSGGMIKIGVFGIVKVGYDLLAASGCEVWWGIVVLCFGAVSSVLGVTYALAEHDIKRLLAYHSVENIGIILMGVGIGLIGWGMGNTVLAVLGLMAALFHTLNHAVFKGLLFLGAGSLLHAVGTRNMEVMGGLAKRMPVTSICFMIASLAISAIPPLNGFVSEWFTYQGIFTAAFTGDAAVKLFAAFAAVALALTGALAVTCFVKAYGVSFLSAPRSEAAAKAVEVPGPMKAAQVLLAILCVFLGVGAPVVVPYMQGIATSLVNVPAIGAVSGAVLVNPALQDSFMSTPLVAVLLIACVLVPVIMRAAAKGKLVEREDPWACGYQPDSHMPVLASTVAAQVREFYAPFYAIRDKLSATAPAWMAFYRKTVKGAAAAEKVGDRDLVGPVAAFVEWISAKVQVVEGGNFRVYIVYIVVALILFLLLTVVL